MTTTINADTIVGGAVVTADASGVLGLQAAGNTGITLNSSRAIGVGAGPSFGTAGQALLSQGSAAAPVWGAVGDVTTTGTQTLTNKTYANAIFDGSITEDVFALSGTSLNPANGTIQTITLASNTTFTDALANGQFMTLMIDDGSSYTVTWPSVTWKTGSGTAPTLNTSGYTVVELWKVDGVLYGARVGDA